MHLQRGLFRLPIPKLPETLKRYEEQVSPLLSPSQLEKTKACISAFGTGDGKLLQEQLINNDKAFPQDSYISADWFDLYLRDRTPLPINYNPSLITRADPDKRDGLIRAAFWIASSLRWYKFFRDGNLKPEVFYFCPPNHYCRQDWFQRMVAYAPESIAAKVMAIGSQFQAFPLDMSQYVSLFNSTRLPKPAVDEIKRSGFTQHIIVNYRSHQFAVTVADEKGSPLPESQIYARLKQIVDTNLTPPTHDVGVFTADNREQWAEARINLQRNLVNETSLTAVDEAIFVLNLDLDIEADMSTSEGANKVSKHLLCASTNRWWDKSFSVTVTKDGTLGVAFEHSWATVSRSSVTRKTFSTILLREPRNR